MVESELKYRIVLVQWQRLGDNAVMLVAIVTVVVIENLVDDTVAVDGLEHIEHGRPVEFLSFCKMMVSQQIVADEQAAIVVVRRQKKSI